MDSLNLFWSLDANNSTKLIVLVTIALLILCIICKPKNKKKVDGYKPTENTDNNKLSKCQIDYKMCQVNSNRGNTDKNFCHVCKPNGDYPDKIHHQNVGWIKVNPKTGTPINK